MKCEAIDFLEYLEGRPSKEKENHVAVCKACREDLERFSHFTQKVLPLYKEGKRQEKELERQLADLDPARLKPLPPRIAEKVKALRDKSLVSRLKKLVDGSRDDAKEWIEAVLHPQFEALPAIPKEITKAKQAKTKRQAAVTDTKKGRKPKV